MHLLLWEILDSFALVCLTLKWHHLYSLQSSFLGRTASGSLASSHRPVYRSYVFGRDDSNSSSRSCISTSESNSDMVSSFWNSTLLYPWVLKCSIIAFISYFPVCLAIFLSVLQDQANSSQPKKAKFSSQPKLAGTRANTECNMNSGVSLFDILRRTSEQSSQESCSTITESQAVHQFSAFKLSRRFSRVGAKNWQLQEVQDSWSGNAGRKLIWGCLEKGWWE